MKWIAVVCDEKVFKNVSERKGSSLDKREKSKCI